ncbi:AAEL014260-PA [Aedes aegypti]|uniref:AAEL014260-PA n=1 Tax=Aedes aegypti TaxID=7159 RepID=Q16GU6_AEDAE|nr:AAEL014260-PA [Aedes aegypti]
MDLSMSSSAVATAREDPFAAEGIFNQQDLPVVPNDNPETYCRLCLTTPDVVPLFPPGTDPNVYILELIGQYIGIGITMEDDFSCAVCTSCQLILDQFDVFRQNCLKVDIAIRRRRLGLDRVIKAEPLPDEDEGVEGELPFVRLENRVYQCRVCTEKFRSMSLFMSHCKEEHPEEAKMYKCKHCPKSFMTKTARLSHIRSHQPSNPDGDPGVIRVQVCERCMETFHSYKTLKEHIKEQHSNDPKQESLVCTTCSRQFSRITILRNHILRVHLGKQPHMCKQCGESFAYAQQLAAHLKAEHGICPNEFGHFDEEQLDDEEGLPPVTGGEMAGATQGGEIAIKEDPDKAANNSISTAVEDAALKQKNRYACIECSVKCESPEELRNHRKIHQDPTWWKCNHCRNFVKHQQMHLQKKHPTIAENEMDASFTIRYRCWMCRMYFKSLYQMEVHANVKHQIPLPKNHQVPPPSEELEEGEIRPDVPSMIQSAVPPTSTLIHAAAAGLPSGIPQPLTVQPPLPFAPEHLPLLLSQLENGAMDYLREFSRLLDPTNQLGLSAQLDIKPNIAALNASMAMDLSGSSALNLSNASPAMNSTANSDGPFEDADGESESEDDTFIRLDNKTYQCKFCPETFRHLQLIRKHTKAQHPSEWKSFKCVHCKRRFPSAPMRDRHAHFHSLNHPCKCTECDQMYSSKKRLAKHFELFHNRNSHSFSMERFRCSSCPRMFVEKKYYDLHSRIYHENKPQRLKNLSEKIQVCERCMTKFDSKEQLVEHIRQNHRGDPPLKNCICTTCHKDLKTVTLLRIHIMVVHMGISPFVCQHCSADFPSRHWLLKHMEKEHSEIALFKCPTCDDSFTTEARLIEHKDKVHAELETVFDAETGMTLYPCTKCEKKLPSKDFLEKHLIKAHPSFMLMYKCPLCNQPIRYRKQHMRVHHDIEYNPKEHPYQVRYKCHCCSKMFQQKRNMLAHQNSLAHQCSRCQMRFKSKKNLSAHMAAHRTNKSLKCEDCGLDFGYRARLDTHRERYHSPNSTQVLKIINCPYCPKLFISPSNRERHIAANHVQSDFKVNCNHCPVQVTDTGTLRKHYKAVHPEERVTFKCPGCERFYLNLSSFKDHYKKHKEDADKSTNSTVDGSDAEGEKSADDKAVKVKQEVQDEDVEKEMGGVGDSGQEPKVEVKREDENGEAIEGSQGAEEGIKDDLIKVDEAKMENATEVKTENVQNGEVANVGGSDDKAKEEAMLVEETENTTVEEKQESSKEGEQQSKDAETGPEKVDGNSVEDAGVTDKAESMLVDESKADENVIPQGSTKQLEADEEGKMTVEDSNIEGNDKPLEEEKVAPEQAEPIVLSDSSESKTEPIVLSDSSESNDVEMVQTSDKKSIDEDMPTKPSEDSEESSEKSESANEVAKEVISEPASPTEKPSQEKQEIVDEAKGDTSDGDATQMKQNNDKEIASGEEQKASEEIKEQSTEKTAAVTDDKSTVEAPKTEDKLEAGEPSQETITAATQDAPDKAETVVEQESVSEVKLPVEEVKLGQVEEKSSDTSSQKNPIPEDSQEKLEQTPPSEVKETEEKSVSEEEPQLDQKTPVGEATSGEPVNESESAEAQSKQGIALGSDVVLGETATVSDAPQVETSSDKNENEVNDGDLAEQSATETAPQEKDLDPGKIEPKEADVPSVDEQRDEEEPPKPSEKVETSEQSESKRIDDCEEPSEEPGHSAPEEKQESPENPEEPQEVPSPSEENSKDETAASEDARSGNNSPTSTAVDSPYTIVESSNEASEISETSSVKSERSTLKRKSAPPSEKRRISTRNMLTRKKRLMVLLDPADVDKLVSLSRTNSPSPSLKRVGRKGSVSTRGSSSESQPTGNDDQMPAKRLRRERRTPNTEGGLAGGS